MFDLPGGSAFLGSDRKGARPLGTRMVFASDLLMGISNIRSHTVNILSSSAFRWKSF